MFHFAFLLRSVFHRSDSAVLLNANNHQQQQQDQDEEEEDNDVTLPVSEDEDEDEGDAASGTRHVESADKFCWTASLIQRRDQSAQVNTCACYNHQRDIFEQILAFSTHPESERLEQLKQFLCTEIQIADDKQDLIQTMTKQAIYISKNYGTDGGSSYIAKNILQCMAFICFTFRCPSPLPHLIKAYEMLMERRKVKAPRDVITWLPWFPLYNRSSALYPKSRKQQWVHTLSFILLATSAHTISTTVPQPTTHINKVIVILYKYYYLGNCLIDRCMVFFKTRFYAQYQTGSGITWVNDHCYCTALHPSYWEELVAKLV
jgi:hypothetical protein